MIVIAYSRDGSLDRLTDVETIKRDSNYIYLKNDAGETIRQFSRSWIVKLEVL